MTRRLAWISAFAAFSLTTTVTAGAQTVGLATSSQGTFGYSAGAAIAKVVSEQTDLNLRVQPFGGSSVYVREINDGAIEFGLANAFETYLAFTGAELFGGKKNEKLQIATTLLPLSVGIYVREDSDIKSLADLKGKKVPGGWTSQAILGPNMSALLANGGITYDDVEMVPVSNLVAAADDFVAGRVDAMPQAVGSASLRQVAAQIPVRLLPISDSPDALDAMRKHLPVAFPLTVPANNQPGISEPTKVMAFYYLLLTHSDVDSEIVFRTVKAIHGGRDGLVAAFRPMAAFSPDRMALDFGTLGLEYHPGAVKFFEESNAWPPKIDGLAAQ